jgi:hypothetical protein
MSLNIKYLFICLSLFAAVFLCLPAYSQDMSVKPPDENFTIEYNKKDPFIASSETLFSNIFLMVLTGYVFKYSWARPTPESINENFTGTWLWEPTDGFKVNNFGHPYQGSFYFNAGRSNGFTFYESFFFNLLGSASWESLGERQQKSINDLITTTIGGASIGEMLHRLYITAKNRGIPEPAALLISPMDSLTGLITGRKPEKETGGLYALSLSAGAVLTDIDYTEKENGQDLYSFRGPAASMAVNAIYGDPFEQKSTIPYEHFELKTGLDVNIGNYMNIYFISDGYLLSFSPINTANDMLSTGLSLHYDFVSLGTFDMFNSIIDQFSNALDFTIKYQHIFNNEFILQLKMHGGGTFFGVSEYYSPKDGGETLKNYGGGINEKIYISIQKKRFGKLSLDVLRYVMWTYPETTAFSSGKVCWDFVDLTYSYDISKNISLGISTSFVHEHGRFDGFPDTEKKSKTQKIFIAWNF